MLKGPITLMTAFGNPFERPPPSRKPDLPAKLQAKLKAFWDSRDNFTAHVLQKDPKIALDLTLEIRVPNKQAEIQCDGWTALPSSQLCIRDVDRRLSDMEVERIVGRKLRSLSAAIGGPNAYDKALMSIRRLVATTTAQRRRLLNGQVHEFYGNYILPFGPSLGRFYFTGKVLRESRTALRTLGFLSALVALARAALRWFVRGRS
jgi:hypothetical protein